MNEKADLKRKSIETIVVSFIFAYGVHYLGYNVRKRYFNFLNAAGLPEAEGHILLYLGHVIFLVFWILFILALKSERRYFMAFLPKKGDKTVLWMILGIATGFLANGICFLSACLHGDISVRVAEGKNFAIFIVAFVVVFIQASMEEIESRCYLFGRMKENGIPAGAAMAVSAFFFGFIHLDNPGFGFIPFLSIFIIGIQYALAYHYFGNVWFTFGAHTMWNYTQDFLFGLPDSGNPAAVSVLNTTVGRGSFFYDAKFGIEGSWMAILLNTLICLVIFLIGRKMKQE